MRMRKKKLLACILAAVMALPGTGMTAWAREEPKPSVELYRNGELLEDGDIIGENDLLYWKTAVDLSDEKELIELPEKLVYAGAKRITMEMPNGSDKEVKAEGFEDFSVIIDNPLYEKKETEAGTGNEPKATPSDGTKVAELSISPRERVMVSSSSKPSTPSDATPSTPKKEDGKETPVGEYTVWVPCRVDSIQLEEDGSLNIMGLNLMVVQNGLELNDVKCELYLSVDGEPGTDPLGDGLEMPVVNKDSDLFLLIQKKNMEKIGAGIEYVVNLQNSNLKAPASPGYVPLKVHIEGKEIQYGTLSWEAGGTELTLEFMDFEEPVEGGKITLKDLTNIRIWFGCNLDVKMDEVDERGQFNIRLPGGKTFDIAVEEWVPKAPQLEKSDGVIDKSTGYVNWTVTYTHPIESYDYVGGKPARIADVMPDGMEYVSGSGNVIVDPPGGGGV